ncbi:MAG: alpha/beta hydrolase, partial [Flavobacteriales bacterium]|nr:alpha/beta hydrolase [Flavobacteriales bacterium]
MKKIFTLLSLVALITFSANAQRYLEEVFDEVTVTTNVTYGMNATVLAYQLLGEAIPEELKMDIYEPTDDEETNRPLILYFHTGNFLPHPQNGGIGGLRTDSSVVELCTRFARMGYVVASCDYRLGWNPLAPTQEERVYTLINAAYRGVQDCRTAVRFFRMSEAEMGDPYHVDTDKIVVWGQGTGGYISFAAATINDYITDIGTNPKFLWDPNEDGIPEPMVIDFVNGDIDGIGYGVNPLDSDTLCYANWPDYDSDFHAMVNMGGAMGDIAWLEDGQIPMISFHTPSDPFAPYDEGTVIVPILNLPVVDVEGSYAVQEQANAFGNNDVFAGLSGDHFTMAANNFNDGFDGLFPMVRPVGMEADSAPWEWWAPDNPNNANGLATNPDMSPEKGRAFCDSIQWYTAPRLACILNLPNNPCSGGHLNDPCDLALDINNAFGGALDVQNEQGPFSNSNATTGGNDPEEGWDCWLEPDGNGDSPS